MAEIGEESWFFEEFKDMPLSVHGDFEGVLYAFLINILTENIAVFAIRSKTICKQMSSGYSSAGFSFGSGTGWEVRICAWVDLVRVKTNSQ